MKQKKYIIGEGQMHNGIDLIHTWVSVEDALNSERFDYLRDNLEYKKDHELYDYNEDTYRQLENCKTMEEFIELMDTDIFYLIEVQEVECTASEIIKNETQMQRSIESIIDELISHPDYIYHTIWTRPLIKEYIEDHIENLDLDENVKNEMIDKIYEMNIEVLIQTIEDHIEYSYSNFYLFENAEFPEELEF